MPSPLLTHRRTRTEKSFDLWWLYWTTILVIASASLILFLSMPGRSGARLSLGLILGGYVLLWGIIIRLAFWLVSKVRLRPVRVALQVLIPVLIVMAREGWLGERVTFDLNLYRSRDASSYTSSFDVKPTETDLSGQTPGCVIAGPAGNAARGFVAEATSAGCRRDDAAAVQVGIDLDARDAFCFTPLFKTATWAYKVRIVLEPPRTEGEQALREAWQQSGLDAKDLEERTDLRSTTELAGEVRRTSYGLESCRRFNEELGRVAAKQALAAYQRLLTQQLERSAQQRKERSVMEDEMQDEQARKKPRHTTGSR